MPSQPRPSIHFYFLEFALRIAVFLLAGGLWLLGIIWAMDSWPIVAYVHICVTVIAIVLGLIAWLGNAHGGTFKAITGLFIGVAILFSFALVISALWDSDFNFGTLGAIRRSIRP